MIFWRHLLMASINMNSLQLMLLQVSGKVGGIYTIWEVLRLKTK